MTRKALEGRLIDPRGVDCTERLVLRFMTCMHCVGWAEDLGT